MKYFILAGSGIIGTLIMTGYLYFLSGITGKCFKVIRILGTMLTGETSAKKKISSKSSSIILGTAVHYMIGILFSITYYWLWKMGIGSPTFFSSIPFGVINGILAAAVWWSFFQLHPNPPIIPLKLFLVHIFLGHILFAVFTTISFILFQDKVF